MTKTDLITEQVMLALEGDDRIGTIIADTVSDALEENLIDTSSDEGFDMLYDICSRFSLRFN